MIYPEKDTDDSKQDLVRMWFADADGLPLVVRQSDLIDPTAFPGTSVWHFGYHRGGWIKRIAGPSQSNPWGRLGRLFFSYPLPFEVHGDLARTDEGRYRTITSPFHRLLKEKAKGKVTYFMPEKREKLMVDGTEYGEFSVLAFVVPEPKDVTNYLESAHPIVLTLKCLALKGNWHRSRRKGAGESLEPVRFERSKRGTRRRNFYVRAEIYYFPPA